MRRALSPSLIIPLIALVIALGGVGYSATGGNFLLGRSNSANTQTRLVTPLAGTAFRIDNSSTASGATALGLFVGSGRTPFTVNSSVKVANLNADRLDGLDSTAFARSAFETWHYVTAFQNGWINYDTDHSVPLSAEIQHLAYRVDSNGVVHIRGKVKNTGSPTFPSVVTNIPGAYCPYFTTTFAIPTETNVGLARVNYSPTYPQPCSLTIVAGAAAGTSFEGVSYLQYMRDFVASGGVLSASATQQGRRR